ncbi:MAG: elongator complex protein 3 [Eubacteriales bacterium]
MNKTKVIPIFIPHAGCPHNCIFCNQKKISGKEDAPTISQTTQIIEDALETIDNNKYKIILAFYGGSFTAIDDYLQEQYLSIAQGYKQLGKIQKIRLSTRPDYIDEERIQLLYKYGVDHIELGVQSTDARVLSACRREYDIRTIENAVQNIQKYHMQYGFQMMLGLPEDSKKKIIKTSFYLLSLNPSTMRVYPTLVIKDTELETRYKRNQYLPLTLENAIEYALIPYIIFSRIQCHFLRIGLHPSESLLYEDNVVAGPFHSAFGELVQSRLYWHMIKRFVEENNIRKKQVIISAHLSNFSKISGNKGENRKKLAEFFDITLKLEQVPAQNNDIIIEYDHKKMTLSTQDYCNNAIQGYMDLIKQS